MKHKVIQLVQDILGREPKSRPEAEWIQRQVDERAKVEGIASRAEMDRLIYEKMYARVPQKTETTKIRYWRTGHHLPTSREEALAFARALQMGAQETTYFLQACMEKSDYVFEEPPGPGHGLRTVYEKRTALMETMLSEYIAFVPPARMFQLNIPFEELGAYARHLYCMDALSTTALAASSHKKEIVENHLSSSNYESEFLRIRRLIGEIPRRTMLRQIVLLGIPYLNRSLVDERLCGLGYLPLTEGHTSQRGALVDDLVIGLLELYENSCRGQDPLACRHWMFEQLSILDQYLLDRKKEEYRFLHFRILSTMAGYGDGL